MKFIYPALFKTMLICLMLNILACRKNVPEPDISNEFEVGMDIRVGGQSIELNSYKYTNNTGNKYKISFVDFYISNFTFEDTVTGEKFTDSSVHYINAEDLNTLKFMVKKPTFIANRTSYTIGIDAKRNVPNGLPSTPQNLSMEWPKDLGGGYHFLHFEGFYNKYLPATSPVSDTLKSFLIHLGRTENLITVNYTNEIKTESLIFIKISLDLNDLLNVNNEIDLRNGYGSIMDKPEKQKEFRENLVNSIKISDIQYIAQ